MKQRHINATLTIAVLALATLLILTALPLAGTAAPRLEQQPLESLSALNSTEATERGAPLSAFSVPSAASMVQSPGTTAHIPAASRSSSPVMFIENVGQFPEEARFQVWGGPSTMWLAKDAIWITLVEPSPIDAMEHFNEEHASVEREDEPRRGVNLRVSFPSANPHSRIEPFDPLDTVVSYFIGNDPDQWHTDVPVWGGVRYIDLYPGVDLEIASEGGHWTWRLVLRNRQSTVHVPDVRLQVEGADDLALDDTALRLATAIGDISLPLLQVAGVANADLDTPALTGNQVVSPFAFTVTNSQSENVKAYSSAPGLLYSTFLGGGGDDNVQDITLDEGGNVYLVGRTSSVDFPTTPGGFDTTHNGSDDVLVVKVNANGTDLIYATFVGGSDGDFGEGIRIDSSGNAYVTGVTRSFNFPTTAGAYDRICNIPGTSGCHDVFVTKMNPDGTELVYSTFLGGTWGDHGYSIAVDETGAAYIAGYTQAYDFPTTPGAFQTTCGSCAPPLGDGFVTKLNPTGTGLVYSTYLGGDSDDWAYYMAVDETSGEAYVTGATYSADFPTASGSFDTSYNGDRDAFVVKFNSAGTDLIYATFLGGSDDDVTRILVTDGSGSAYVGGATSSTDFPVTSGAFNTTYNGAERDGVVAKLSPDGDDLDYATFLGGSNNDFAHAIAVDEAGGVYVTGFTYSTDFPTTPCALDTTYNGGRDAFVVKVNTERTGLVYATFLGGSEIDGGTAIAVDGTNASTYVAGRTKSSDFPFTPGAFDTSYNGNWDAFVTKLLMEGEPGLCIAHIEVTQATQDENNSVPLIASKPTFVRVYMNCGPGCTSVPNVTGVLRGYGPSGELSGSPLSPVNQSITVYHHGHWRNQRDDLHKTLNFTLPLEWLTETITLTAEISEAIHSQVVTFKPTKMVKVMYVPIRYQGRLPDISRVRNGSWWAFRVFPMSTIAYFYVPRTTLPWELCLEKGNQCRDRDDNLRLLYKELMNIYRFHSDADPYVYGWLPEESCGGGYAWLEGRFGHVAFGDDHPTEGPYYFAHEIAHLMGRMHTNTLANLDDSECKLNPEGKTDMEKAFVNQDSDWLEEDGLPGPPPFPDSKIWDYGLDDYGFGWRISSSSAVKRPSNTYDYMSYCGQLARRNIWTSSWTYEHIYSETLRSETTALASHPLAAPQPYFISGGLVYTDDTATLDPIWVITSTVMPKNPPAGTEYCLEAQDTLSTPLVSYCFDLAFIDYETVKATDVDGFNLMLPYPSDVARIVLKKGTTELAVQSVSANAPMVTVLSPNGGETWDASSTYTVTWTVSDADGDQLTYRVLYSPDESDWTPVGTTITQTQVAVNAAELSGSTSARIRVLASDGINTSSDESDAPFTVGRKPPQVFIISPETDNATLEGTPVWLEGSAYDLEDGTLGDAALAWTSSRDGDLGTGAQVLASLSLGQHALTLTATDSDANTATATVQVVATFPEDVVPDCQIDIADIMQVASHWRCKCEDECYVPLYDLDGDCDIDVVDIMLVVVHWGETC